MTLEMYFN